jgi:hypothetical protein
MLASSFAGLPMEAGLNAGAAAIKHEAQQPIRKGLCQWLVDSF